MVCSFVFFWIFKVLAIWSRPCKNLENQKKQKKQNCRPHWGSCLTCGHVVFWIFEVFAWSAPDGQNLENPKKQKRTKLQTTCPQSQTRAPMGSAVFFFLIFEVCASPMGSAVLFFCFFKNVFEVFASPMGSAVLFFWVFRGFCMVCFAVYYCCYHIKLPFTLRNPCRTLQNLAKSKLSHLPPPHPPLSSFNSCFRGSMALAPQSMSFR